MAEDVRSQYAPCSIRDLFVNDEILYGDRNAIVQEISGTGQSVTLVIKAHYRRIVEQTRENDVVKRRVRY